MTTLSGPRDYHRDVSDPAFRAAEESFRRACPWPLADNRDAMEPWDFWVWLDGWKYSLDVKHDRLMHVTRRVAFELIHSHADGRMEPGWGRHPRLDLVAYVPAFGRDALVYSVPAIRAYVEANQGDAHRLGWMRFAPRNRKGGGAYETHGWAIPITRLEAADALIAVIDLTGKETTGGLD